MEQPLKHLYVLLLQSNKYYVGLTSNIETRYKAHQAGTGSTWTTKYPPIRMLYSLPNKTTIEEDAETKRLMSIHGIDNVRGGSYTMVNLPTMYKLVLQHELRSISNACWKCGIRGHYANVCQLATMKDKEPILETKDELETQERSEETDQERELDEKNLEREELDKELEYEAYIYEQDHPDEQRDYEEKCCPKHGPDSLVIYYDRKEHKHQIGCKEWSNCTAGIDSKAWKWIPNKHNDIPEGIWYSGVLILRTTTNRSRCPSGSLLRHCTPCFTCLRWQKMKLSPPDWYYCSYCYRELTAKDNSICYAWDGPYHSSCFEELLMIDC